jgi:alpha-tubulin suppressor-like RCC1 family protein
MSISQAFLISYSDKILSNLLWTWGNGSSGQLGTNDVINSFTPVITFSSGINWKQVSAGTEHTAAIKTDGTLWTWGNGSDGRLGTNDTTNKSTPVTTFAGGTNWEQVAAGGSHTSAVKTDGTLWTWGNGADGRLGTNNTTSRSTPVTTFAGGTNWKQVSSGGLHTVAVKTDRTLWTWGNGSSGQLGNNNLTNRLTPVTTFSGGTNWEQVAAGGSHTTSVKSDGSLWTWGNGSGGKLGNTLLTDRSTPVTTFTGGTDWKQVAAGAEHTAAVKTDGTLWIWGNGDSGVLGNSLGFLVRMLTPVTTFAGGNNWTDTATTPFEPDELYTLSAGSLHTTAIKTDGTLWIWGSESSGRLGNGVTTGTISTPVTTFAGGTSWKQISSGDSHTAAIKTDGTLWTWGNGDSGRLGRQYTDNAGVPVRLDPTNRIWADTATGEPDELYTLSAGTQHTAAIKTDGTLWTWGFGEHAALGDNTITNRSTPITTLSGGSSWKQVSAGDRHTAAIKTDGTLWTWGTGSSGQLGTNDTTTRSTPVTTFAGGTNWKQVSAGTQHTAATKTDGTLWTWGNNDNGSLGRQYSTTVQVPVGLDFSNRIWADTATGEPDELYTLSAGTQHTAAIKTDGTLWTWGNGSNGTLGNGNSGASSNRSTPVTTFAGGTNWKQVSAGSQYTAAIKTDGTLWTWGNGDSGRLGDTTTGTFFVSSTPVTTFAGGTNWKQVSAGDAHTAAIKTDGTLWTWGNSGSGRLGRQYSTTVQVPVGLDFSNRIWADTATGEPDELYTLSAGTQHTAAIKTDGTLWTWGNGGNGRLGDGNASTFARITTPVTTFAGGTNWKQVSAGGSHTAAVKTDGTLWTWGNGGSGKLGDTNTGVFFVSSTPVTTFAGGTNWKQVSAGNEHTSAIKTDGTLWTWGNASVGQLGNNATTNRSTPVTTFAGGNNWKQVSSGSLHTSAVKTDGTLWTWGNGDSGRLGRQYSTTVQVPVRLDPTNRIWADTATGEPDELYTLSAGSFYTSAVKTDGTLWTWGTSDNGRLGDGNASSTTRITTPVTTFAGGTNWKQVSAGNEHTSAIKTDGTLWLWGLGGRGRLGNAATAGNVSTPVTTFAGGTNWKQVSSGFDHTAAIKTDGTLWTWGFSSDGRLGNAITGNFSRSTPVTTFAGGTNWKQVSAGYGYTAAIKTDGTLWIWGFGGNGRLGTDDTTTRSTPVTTFAGGTNWKQVSASNAYTAAIKTDGTLWTWGFNNTGQLGTNDTTSRSTPVTTFSGGTDWKQVSCGNGTVGSHTSAVKTDGTLWTWGNGNSGRLGTNDTTNRSTPVTTFAGGTNWKQVSSGNGHTVALRDDGVNKDLFAFGANADTQLGIILSNTVPGPVFSYEDTWKQVSSGNSHTAAVKTDGTLWTWGDGFFGVLGNNDRTDKSTPVTTFAGGTNWKQVSAGTQHTAAIKTDGTLWTWGDGTSGRLGTNDTTTRSTPVTTFAGGTDWKQVAAGGSHTIALRDDGVNKDLFAFGNNNNVQLGIVVSDTVPGPVFSYEDTWKQISSGSSHTAAIKTDGTLWTWGSGTSGRLGTNDTTTRSTPVTTFAGGTNWKQVSAGDSHTAAVKTDGTLWTWGSGFTGRLGTNDATNRSTPVTTFAGGTNWKQVSAGYQHTSAVKTDGTLWTWGNGNSGRLGTNDETTRSTPVTTFAGGTNWKQVSAGNAHTVALRNDGVNKDLFAFGNNNNVQLGIFVPDIMPGPVFSYEDTWKQVSAGRRHTAAVKTDGTLWAWGNGTDGRLGDTNDSPFLVRSTPITTFAGGTNWKQVSAGDSHTAAVKTDGTLWTWGNGNSGRLGDTNAGTFFISSTPVTTFAGGTNWKQVSAGYQHTSAVKTDGTLWTWGDGFFGTLGNNDGTDKSTPVTTFAGGTNWKQVSAGRRYNVALRDDGINKDLFAFGLNSSNQLGIVVSDTVPGSVFSYEDTWKQVAAGTFHTAAIKTDGTLWTWGNGTSGQLGNAQITDRSTPVTTFAGGTNWKQVSSGYLHTAAVKTDGTLWTWGSGSVGRLGTNDATTRSTPVTTFAGGTNWKQVTAGGSHTAAVKTDGTLWTWGLGTSGQLGNRVITLSRSTPVTTFAGGTNWKQVSAGSAYTAAIKTDGTLWTWGAGSYGQLGINDATNRSTPVTTFAGGTNWKQVAAGTDHTVALRDDGVNKELFTFGATSDGKLGVGPLPPEPVITSTPVTTFAGGTNWKQVATGDSHTAAVKTDGTLWTWGLGSSGQLGINDATNRSTPVTTFAGGTDWEQVTAGGAHTAALYDESES